MTTTTQTFWKYALDKVSKEDKSISITDIFEQWVNHDSIPIDQARIAWKDVEASITKIAGNVTSITGAPADVAKVMQETEQTKSTEIPTSDNSAEITNKLKNDLENKKDEIGSIGGETSSEDKVESRTLLDSLNDPGEESPTEETPTNPTHQPAEQPIEELPPIPGGGA